MLEKLNEILSEMQYRIDDIDDYINKSKSGTIARDKATISREQMFSFLDDLRADIGEIKKFLPSTLTNAKKILEESQEMISNAKKEADKIIEAARNVAEQMSDKDQVAIDARALATKIKEEAIEESKILKHETNRYIYKNLGKFGKKIEYLAQVQDQSIRDLREFYDIVTKEVNSYRADIREEQKDGI